jgi:hypothetical protein
MMEHPPIPPDFDDLQVIALETLWKYRTMPDGEKKVGVEEAKGLMQLLGAEYIDIEEYNRERNAA